MADGLGRDPPNRVTDSQIISALMHEMREGRKEIVDNVEDRLRNKNPPPNGAKWLPTLNTVLAGLFAAGLALIGWTYTRIDAVERRASDNSNAVAALKLEDERIRAERDALKLARDEQIKGVLSDLREMKDYGIRIGNVEGSVNEVRKLYEGGRSERLDAQDKAGQRINTIDTQLQILQDRLSREGRDRAPFDQNRIEIDPRRLLFNPNPILQIKDRPVEGRFLRVASSEIAAQR